MIKEIYEKISANEISFAIIDDEKIIYTDKSIGVKPIIKVIEENPMLIKNNIIVDKVIGKAAALLLIKYKVKKVCGYLMSETAIDMLERYNIEYEFQRKVKYITNRTNDGLCPLEDSVKDTDDLDDAEIRIKERIKILMNNEK